MCSRLKLFKYCVSFDNASNQISMSQEIRQGLSKCEKCKQYCDEFSEDVQMIGQFYYHCSCIFCCGCLIQIPDGELYQSSDKDIYCRACAEIYIIHTCETCHEPILDNKVTLNYYKSYHTDCYKCNRCSLNLVDKTKKDINGKLFCSTCALEIYNANPRLLRCNVCCLPVFSESDQRKCLSEEFLKDTDYFRIYEDDVPILIHKLHFVCTRCGVSLTQDAVNQYENFTCYSCFLKLKIPVCDTCFEPITGRCIRAHNLNYHSYHFRCKECSISLDISSFKSFKNQVFCNICYGIVSNKKSCTVCFRNLSTIKIDDNFFCRYHIVCFSCGISLSNLKRDEIKSIDNKVHCKNCIIKIQRLWKDRYSDKGDVRKLFGYQL
ncbi:MAG: LIM and senescent cell antigen-like-containing domain protein 2 [Marteilia pararefringens]